MPIKEKRRVEVYWETHEITKVRFKGNDAATFFCPPCQTATPHLTISEAASIFSISEFRIRRLVEAKQIHSVENPMGDLLVCGGSLAVFEGRTYEK